ncbi:DUF1285 domain-containing protein [Vulgatibacter sp.]|uniref:DUF1285 domain-containing protein n=1 Tax=Vulgatibacter sp. TaxID=1971226 RepID=UPI0035646A4E
MTDRLHTRVDSGIRLDPFGRFWHDEELVVNPAIARSWHKGLERAEDGRYLIRFGRDWAFVTVDDAPYTVKRLSAGRDGFRLLLSDESEETLDPRTLARSAEDVVYCRVKSDHRARFSRQAQADLMEFLQEDQPGRFVLVSGADRWPIGDDPGRPPPRPEEGAVPEDNLPRGLRR